MGVGIVKILLLIVLLLGLVLILGYHQLTFESVNNGNTDNRDLSESKVQFNFRRSGFTSSPAPDSPSLFADKDSPVFNRTVEADNQNVVFFNRVPKTGSEMFQEFTKVLGNLLGYHSYIDPTPMSFFPGHDFDVSFAEKFNRSINDTGVYFRHIPYFNFTANNMPRPIYLSMVRHPIERVVSWFYYIRWRNRPDEQQDQKICKKNPEWKRFCDQFSTLRFQELLKPSAWFDMDFDTCVLTGHPECDFTEGQGGWKYWSERKDSGTGQTTYVPSTPFYQDYRNQMMFFCGNNPDCIALNSKHALNIAKQVVEKFYSVVGVLEQLDKSLETVEAMVPKFYRNAKDIYKKNASNKDVTQTNKNPNKKKLSDKVRKYLERKLDREIEFYDFCVQRLENQWNGIRTISRFSDVVEWPPQLSEAAAVDEDDDYVML